MHRVVGLLVAIGALIAYGSAFAGVDATGHRLQQATIFVALVGSVALWGMRRRWAVGAGFLLAKAGAVVALLPQGEVAALWMSYADGRAIPGYLNFFWITPALMLGLSMVEAWGLGLIDRGEGLSDTRLWSHRHSLALVVGLLSLGGGLWRHWRAEYYLWRLHVEGHGPHSASLESIGPPVLPRLYEELKSLEREPAGDVRSTIVAIIADIRYRQVAIERRESLVTVVATTPSAIDRPMVNALISALDAEPDDEQRGRMTNWLSRVDYRMALTVFCEGLPKVPGTTLGGMLRLLDGPLAHATRDVYPEEDSLYPWRGMAAAQIAERKAAILKEARACAPSVLATKVAACEGCDGHAVETALELLAAMAPLSDGEKKRAKAAIAKVVDRYRVTRVLESIGLHLDEDRAQLTLELMAGGASAKGASAPLKEGVIYWLSLAKDPKAVERVICQGLAGYSDEELRMLLTTSNIDGKPCVVAALKSALEVAAGANRGRHAIWLGAAENLLAPRKDVAEWAAELLERHPESSIRYTLSALANP
jgi:hypothetical protein